MKQRAGHTSPTSLFAQLVDGGGTEGSGTEEPGTRLGTAVVLGAGMAGLFAARTLADRCETVLLVERDGADPATGPRHGVPQGHHVHVLLSGACEQLERWYPGIVEQAQDAGAVLSTPAMIEVHVDGAPVLGPPETRLLGATRSLVERLVRERTLGAPNVRLVPGRVRGLVTDSGTVRGVAVTGADGVDTTLDADLVVDATGRGSRAGTWLTDAGLEAPAVERVPAGVAYSSALFERTPGTPDVGGAQARFSPGAGPGGVAMGAVTAVEDDRWMVMLVGHDGERPGRTEPEFRNLTSRMPGLFPRTTEGALVEPVATYHIEDNVRRRYDLLPGPPPGFVAVGDAVASTNPSFGLGIVSSALHAVVLSRWLTEARSTASTASISDFFAEQRVAVDATWAISAGVDAVRIDPPVGGSPVARLTRWVQGRLQAASMTDRVVARHVWKVAEMRAHPATLGSPRVLGRVLLVALMARARRVRRAARRTPSGPAGPPPSRRGAAIGRRSR